MPTNPLKRPLFPVKSVGLFMGLGLLVYISFGWVGMWFFPGQSSISLLLRAGLAAVGILVLLLGSRHVLQQEHFPADPLGLRPTWAHVRGFGFGIVSGSLFYLLIISALGLQVTFQWERGALSFTNVLLAAHTYFWTSWGEELLFRGCVLLILIQYVGTSKAVWLMALLFGLFHLPGMAGLAALKMVATTGSMSLVFSYSFLLTGTLWIAIGFHMMGNVWLHTLTDSDGSGQATYWTMVATKLWPTDYDASFWTFLLSTGLLAFLLFRWWRVHQ